jgi:hypothetical protein
MPHYQFSIHEAGAKSEKLGSDNLDNDAEALAFANRVIRDLMYGKDKRSAGWTMDIADGERAVSSILIRSESD